ncbi:hypothetical protein EV182_003374, partial [Spiromyces aspiralis]
MTAATAAAAAPTAPPLPRFDFSVEDIKRDTKFLIDHYKSIDDKIAAISLEDATFENVILPLANPMYKDPSRDSVIRSLKE